MASLSTANEEKNQDVPPSKGDEAPDVQNLPAKNDSEIVYPTGFKLYAIILALCLAIFLVALDQTIIATAIPRITDRFNSVLDIGWYGSVSLPLHSLLHRLLIHPLLGLFSHLNFTPTLLWPDLQDFQRV
jgi:hypothetical protein